MTVTTSRTLASNHEAKQRQALNSCEVHMMLSSPLRLTCPPGRMRRRRRRRSATGTDPSLSLVVEHASCRISNDNRGTLEDDTNNDSAAGSGGLQVDINVKCLNEALHARRANSRMSRFLTSAQALPFLFQRAVDLRTLCTLLCGFVALRLRRPLLCRALTTSCIHTLDDSNHILLP
ncbi:hypothetical protein FA95DRAFT_1298293 [Auriscalpium vulgare]|uniref:Uncharacterized protein n=1 Tax=Auriscalpium vulgare TaxID=40419 RepID=A0ACB8R1R2_9AGAM|nr:hypothetical protein FA95DRAFT_1298293 [Auriscalpium vulgare]